MVEEPGQTSGLTPVDVRPVPILFGSRDIQNALLEIASQDSVPYEKSSGCHRRLVGSGICKIIKQDDGNAIVIDPGYPAINELCAVLCDLLEK